MVMVICFKLITISPQEDWLSLVMYDRKAFGTTPMAVGLLHV